MLLFSKHIEKFVKFLFEKKKKQFLKIIVFKYERLLKIKVKIFFLFFSAFCKLQTVNHKCSKICINSHPYVEQKYQNKKKRILEIHFNLTFLFIVLLIIY